VPLASGGPYFGFMCCRRAHMRQMPGRIVGRTVDLDGHSGYSLTLQAREQHIRRSKATSNICTNQGLMVTAATIHMALLGGSGLRATAQACHANTRRLLQCLQDIDGVTVLFSAPRFHEAVIRFETAPAATVLERLAAQGILGGYSLQAHYPELGEALLLCATETKSETDIDHYARALRHALAQD